MADNAYVSSFGIVRYMGAGEGQELKNRTDIVTEYLYPVKRIITQIDFDKYGLPTGNTLVPGDNSFARGIAKLPKNSLLVSAKLYVLVKGADASKTINVGVAKKDGTVIDEDGLIAAAAISTGTKTGAGALIDTILADDSYIVATKATGTDANFANLKGELVVEYVDAE